MQAARSRFFDRFGFFGSREDREAAKGAKIQRWSEAPFFKQSAGQFLSHKLESATRNLAQLLRDLRVKQLATWFSAIHPQVVYR